ncbi:MAG: TrmH family RNA methyltransferase [Bdellovibrionaceae bacterium]|nr:TrmH family RNA methyltransferase [Pseudobdellovibrionaceae bacterium]
MNGNTESKALQEVLRLFRELETKGKDADFPSDTLNLLLAHLRALQGHPDPNLRRVGEFARHLHPQMTLKHLTNFIVPVERMLHRRVQDEDFLVTTVDRKIADPLLRYPAAIVLENLRSAFNVGSILRSADGLGAKEIIFTGYSPTPEQEKTLATALGAENSVNWRYIQSTSGALKELKIKGYRIVGAETARNSKELSEPFAPGPTAFVFGNERFGLEAETLSLCDEVRIINMVGVKNSLNVAVVAGIFLYEWRRQWLGSN